MWALIVEMLTSLKEEKEVVDSVLEDCVNPCILDGTDVVLRLPRLLNYRVASYKYSVSVFCPCQIAFIQSPKMQLNTLKIKQVLNGLLEINAEGCMKYVLLICKDFLLL